MFAAHRGQRFNFVRIDGASVTEARLNELVSATVAEEVGADHSVVLLDEAGKLFHRGLEQKCRPSLEHPSVVTDATAQDFHSKRRKTDTEEEDKNRYLSFLSRFRKKIYTEKPTEEEVFEFILGHGCGSSRSRTKAMRSSSCWRQSATAWSGG